MYTLVLPPVLVLLLNVSHEQLRFNPSSSSFSTPTESAPRSRKVKSGFEPGASSEREWTCESLIEATIFDWEIGFGLTERDVNRLVPPPAGRYVALPSCTISDLHDLTYRRCSRPRKRGFWL